MTFEVQIRLASSEDAEAVSRVLHDSFAEFEASYTPAGFAATTPSAEQVRTRMEEGPVWIAVRDDRGLGTVAAVCNGEPVYMRGMAVVPAARGLGIGPQLLQTVENWACEQGAARLFLSTTPFLHAAIHLYEKCGFQRVKSTPYDLFGTPLFTMEKNLSQRR